MRSKGAAKLQAIVQDVAQMAAEMAPHAADLAGGEEANADDQETPALTYDLFHTEFDFTLDVAASTENAKCLRYCTPEGFFIGKILATTENGLVFPWDFDERVWCNPPFSNVRPWVERAWDEPAELVAMLLPNNRAEQGFWQDMIEPYRDRAGSILTTRNLRKRRAFGARVNGQLVVRRSPPFGLVLVVWDRRRPAPLRLKPAH